MIQKLWSWLRKVTGGESNADQRSHCEQEEVVPVAPRKPVREIATGRTFAELALDPLILRGLEEAGFTHCTEVQDRALPHTLEGKDIAAQAQTGSGKTAVFLITIFQRYLEARKKGESFGQALILAPTRELALQIVHDADQLGRYCGLRYATIIGGVSYDRQVSALKEGADVVIATPGRLIDLMKQRLLDPRRVSMLVIDEADRMLDMGFVRDLRYILRRLPHYSKRQSLLFSATLSLRVLELTYEYMDVSEEIVINPKELVVETVDQCVYHVARHEKFSLLLGLLKHEEWERILIFSNTKVQASEVARRLKGNGYSCGAITGDLNQKQRIRILNRFKAGEVPILVATDVASRGLHIEDVSHVINYDVPQDREEYVHRIGRTARAGKAGKAITLASERDVYHLEPIEALLGERIPVLWAEDEMFLPDRSHRQRTDKMRKKTRRPTARKGTVRKGKPAAPKRKDDTAPAAKKRPAQRKRRPRRRPRRSSGAGGQGAKNRAATKTDS